MGKSRQLGWLIPWFKYFLYFFNVFSVLIAIAIFTLALWIRYDWDFKEYVHELQSYQVWVGPHILLAASVIVMFFSFVGCYATVNENPRLLSLYAVILGIAFVLEISGLAYALDHGVRWSKIHWWLEERFKELLYMSAYSLKAARILRIIQEEVRCCASGGWLDYANLHWEVPMECRDPQTGIMYVFGCAHEFSVLLESRMGWISGIALFLAVLQILGIIACCSLRSLVNREIRTYQEKSYNPVRVSAI